MKRAAAIIVAIVFSLVSSVHADYTVTDHGTWPNSWPKELEPLRKQSQTFGGPIHEMLHHAIAFTTRDEFESAWPHLLKVKSRGAPIVLRRGPSFWLGDKATAGVCVHTPPAGEAPIADGKDAKGNWEKTLYIELIVDGEIIDLNRILLPADTPIIDERFPKNGSEKQVQSTPTESKPQALDLPWEWVTSDDSDLSLRLRVKSALLATQDSIFVIAEIRNNTSRPVTILRPLGYLQLLAYASQIKIWGEQGQIKYIGPIADYVLDETSFITLEAKEITTDTLELSVTDFAETSKAGNYAVRYDYSYQGGYEKRVADEGLKGIWHGAISSREIQLKKQEGIPKVPRPSQEQLNTDLRKLSPLAAILNEKPDDPTARQDAAALAVRLAPHLPKNRMVWEVLIKTRSLKDGMSLKEAEELLGPPARRSDKFVGWYANPDSKHVTPYLRANVRKDGLAKWTLTNQ